MLETTFSPDSDVLAADWLDEGRIVLGRESFLVFVTANPEMFAGVYEVVRQVR